MKPNWADAKNDASGKTASTLNALDQYLGRHQPTYCTGGMVLNVENGSAPGLTEPDSDSENESIFDTNMATPHQDALQRFHSKGYCTMSRRCCPRRDASIPASRGRMVYFLLHVERHSGIAPDESGYEAAWKRREVMVKRKALGVHASVK